MAKRKNWKTGFGQRLRVLRERAELSQEQLGVRAGIFAQTIAKYERGASEPTWPIVLRLARALGCELNEFKGPEDDQPAREPVPEPPPRARARGKLK